MSNTLFPLDRVTLTDLLIKAQTDHHNFEQLLGFADPAWAPWYANQIMTALESANGQQTNLAFVQNSPVTAPQLSTGPFDNWSGVKGQPVVVASPVTAEPFPCWKDAVAAMNPQPEKDYDSDGSEGEGYRDDYSSAQYFVGSDLSR